MATVASTNPQGQPAFNLTFAGVPFALDLGKDLRTSIARAKGEPRADADRREHSPPELVTVLDRMVPFRYLDDFSPPPGPSSPRLAGLARRRPSSMPNPQIRIGDWYYPSGATRWSVFRGLATSSQAAIMLASVQPTESQLKTIPGVQQGTGAGSTSSLYTPPPAGLVPPPKYPGATITSVDALAPPAGAAKIGSVDPFSVAGTGGKLYSVQPTAEGTWLPRALFMRNSPLGPGNESPTLDAGLYSVLSPMYLLPPRPLAETAGYADGLYLITLVDERYWWRSIPATVRVGAGTTWDRLLGELAVSLRITLYYDAIEEAYGRPEPDSPLWADCESAADLLEAVAANLGRVVVRNLDGSYSLHTAAVSAAYVEANRSLRTPMARAGGGDIFQGAGTLLPAGSLERAKNAPVPEAVVVSFPKYVVADAPVPHFVNPRYTAFRPTSWHEENLAETYNVTVPVAEGGSLADGLVGVSWSGRAGSGAYSTAGAYFSGSPVPIVSSGSAGFTVASGLLQPLRSTAKALLNAESDPAPLNNSLLVNLAKQLAKDFYGWRVGAALDEVYPGTISWAPEGFHDLIWTFSARAGGGYTRVLKTRWDDAASEFQHGTPVGGGVAWGAGGSTGVAATAAVRGAGGPSVAQTWRDTFSGYAGSQKPSTTLYSALASGGASAAVFDSVDYFPTDHRWKGKVDDEVILFDGTSGGYATGPSGVFTGLTVTIPFRGIDGTLQAEHGGGSTVRMLFPHTSFGVNLVTYGPGQHTYPSEWTSGGVQGVEVVPQLQTVEVLSETPAAINQTNHYSGRVRYYDPTVPNSPFAEDGELIWVVPRGSGVLKSGAKLGGQFGGYSASGPVTTVYLVDPPGEGPGPTDINFFRQATSGLWESGNIERWYTADTGTGRYTFPFAWPIYTIGSGYVRLIPFITPAGGKPDALATYLGGIDSTDPGSTYYGVYERVSVNKNGVENILPGRLIFSGAGLPNLCSGQRSMQSLGDIGEFKKGELYWLAHYTTGSLNLRAFESRHLFPVLGLDPRTFEQSFSSIKISREYLINSGHLPSAGSFFPLNLKDKIFDDLRPLLIHETPADRLRMFEDGNMPLMAIRFRFPNAGQGMPILPQLC